MAKKRFNESVPGGLKDVLKFAVGAKYYLKVLGDYVDSCEEWCELWPTVNGEQKLIKRRFVGNEDNSNIQPLLDIKKSVDIPKGEESNWNIRPSRALVVMVGSPQIIKKDGKKRTKIIWDKTAKIWLIGMKATRRLEEINNNDELKDNLEEKGYDTDKPTLAFYSITLKKISTGSGIQMVDYEIDAGKLVGETEIGTIDNYEEVVKALEDHAKPSKKSEAEAFIDKFIEGNEESEADSKEEADDEEEEDEEPVKKSKKPGKTVSKDDEEDEDEEEEEDEEEDEDEDEEDEPVKKSKKPGKKVSKDEDEDEDIDPDDVDVEEVEADDDEEEEDEEPVKKSKKKKI